MTSLEQVHVAVEDRMATITLDRPSSHHALGVQLVDELGQALDHIEKTDEVRVIILTATGERAFCSGADLKERREMGDDSRWAHNRAIHAFVQRLANMQVPVIAAINGLAFGGGLEITLACDFRIAADHVELAVPEVGIGVIPGAGGTQRLPRLIGPTKAKELIFTGRRINATSALEMGMLSQVAVRQDLTDKARELAQAVARNSPLAVAYAKLAIDAAMETTIEQGLRFETAATRTTLNSRDYEIGLEAFAEKRPPEFLPPEPRRVI